MTCGAPYDLIYHPVPISLHSALQLQEPPEITYRVKTNLSPSWEVHMHTRVLPFKNVYTLCVCSCLMHVSSGMCYQRTGRVSFSSRTVDPAIEPRWFVSESSAFTCEAILMASLPLPLPVPLSLSFSPLLRHIAQADLRLAM